MGRLMAAGLAGLCTAATWFLVDLWQREMTYKEAEAAVHRWAEQGYVEDASRWRALAVRLGDLPPRGPADARRLELLGDLWYWQAYQQRFDPATQRNSVAQATAFYRAALAIRPADAGLWVRLLQAMLLDGAFDEEAVAAYQGARRTGPYEPAVVKNLLWVVLTHWQGLPRSVRRDLPSLVAAAERSDAGRDGLLRVALETGQGARVLGLVRDERLGSRLRQRITERARRRAGRP